MFKHTPYPCILLLFLMLSGSLACMHSNVYEKNYTLKGHQWNEADIPSFAFEISDTSAAYSLYFTIRHTDAYPFSNIWLQQQTMAPGEQQAKTVRIEIPLAQTDGKWLGRGMGEIWEQRLLLNMDGAPLHFSKPGLYHLQLRQLMRTNPLPDILSVGIRLEKNTAS